MYMAASSMLVYVHDHQQYVGLCTWPRAVCWSMYMAASSMLVYVHGRQHNAALPNGQARIFAGQFYNVTLRPGSRSQGRGRNSAPPCTCRTPTPPPNFVLSVSTTALYYVEHWQCTGLKRSALPHDRHISRRLGQSLVTQCTDGRPHCPVWEYEFWIDLMYGHMSPLAIPYKWWDSNLVLYK